MSDKMAWDDHDYGEDDDPDVECCVHEEYDADVLTGRATCHYCGHSWWQTEEEIAAEIERIRSYDEWQQEQNRPWFRFKQLMRDIWLLIRPRRRQRSAIIGDDEIPF